MKKEISSELQSIKNRIKVGLDSNFENQSYSLVKESDYLEYVHISTDFTDRLTISVVSNNLGTNFAINVFANRYINTIEKYLEEYKEDAFEDFTIHGGEFIIDKFGGESNANVIFIDPYNYDLAEICEEIWRNWEKVLLVNLNKYSNLKTLDSLINIPFDGQNGRNRVNSDWFWFYKIIVAGLSNNPDFNKIYEHYYNLLYTNLDPISEYYNIRKKKLFIATQIYSRILDNLF